MAGNNQGEEADVFEDITGAVRETVRPPQGCNFDVTILLAQRGQFVVKTGNTVAKVAALEREGTIVNALAAYQPFVPYLLGREGDHFLFTCLEGVNLATVAEETRYSHQKSHLAEEYGRALAHIHTLHSVLPVPDDWLSDAVAKCRRNVESGAVSGAADVFSAHAGRPVAELLIWLEAERHKYRNELRLCHGDWCLPNALVEGGLSGRITGAVDWGDGGYADYRYDLATGLWSLRRNGLESATDRFLAAYAGEERNDLNASLLWFEAIYALL